MERDQKETFCLLKTAEVGREYVLYSVCVQLETNGETLSLPPTCTRIAELEKGVKRTLLAETVSEGSLFNILTDVRFCYTFTHFATHI